MTWYHRDDRPPVGKATRANPADSRHPFATGGLVPGGGVVYCLPSSCSAIDSLLEAIGRAHADIRHAISVPMSASEPRPRLTAAMLDDVLERMARLEHRRPR